MLFWVGWMHFVSAALLSAQTVVGAYPTYPPAGLLQSKSPTAQAQYLKSIGITLAGGRFENRAMPDALRAVGIQTLELVGLWQGEEHWKSHPASRPITAAGTPLQKEDWYAGVCPNQPWLRELKLKEIASMLRSSYYDVIVLDFIRYPVRWESPQPDLPDTCYCPVCLERFQKDSGIRIPSTLAQVADKAAWIKANHAKRWYRWRADQITGFCAEVKKLRDKIRPQTLIGLAAIPWQSSDFENAIYRVVGQDFKSLAEVIDVFSPMSYHVYNNRPVEWIGDVNASMRRETRKPIWPFVIFNQKIKESSREEWRETFRQALSNGATGFIAFPYNSMVVSEGHAVFVEMFAK